MKLKWSKGRLWGLLFHLLLDAYKLSYFVSQKIVGVGVKCHETMALHCLVKKSLVQRLWSAKYFSRYLTSSTRSRLQVLKCSVPVLYSQLPGWLRGSEEHITSLIVDKAHHGTDCLANPILWGHLEGAPCPAPSKGGLCSQCMQSSVSKPLAYELHGLDCLDKWGDWWRFFGSRGGFVHRPTSSCLHSLCAIGVAWGICLVVKPCCYGAEGQSWKQFLTERLL